MDEGKTLDDIKNLNVPSTSWSDSPESIIRAIGDILYKAPKPTETNAYRRLRTFSGIRPTPLGEESLEGWLQEAKLMVEVCEKEDRRKS